MRMANSVSVKGILGIASIRTIPDSLADIFQIHSKSRDTKDCHYVSRKEQNLEAAIRGLELERPATCMEGP
jgi:hypothetical protein